MNEAEPYRPGVVTTEVLRDLAETARDVALTGDAPSMAFTLGRIAEWATCAARTAEAAEGAEAQ